MDEWRYDPAHDLGLSERERRRSLQRESGLLDWAGRNLWWGWVHGMLRLLERVEVRGAEHLPPAPPFVLVANHASHLDAMVLATALPLRLRNHVFPIAAGDAFFKTPLVAAFASGMMNALPMWRKNCGRHAMDQLRQRLVAEPCAYILFPEGTRSRDGSMAPFKSGIGMILAGTPVPVIPCHLHGTHDALPPGKTWPRRARITLRIGPPHTFSATPNTREGWVLISQQLENAVQCLATTPP